MVKEAHDPTFPTVKEKSGKSIWTFITTEHRAMFIAEDNVLLTEQPDPECPDRFRWFWCLVKQTLVYFVMYEGILSS